VPISAALRQGPHIKVAAVASCWQRNISNYSNLKNKKEIKAKLYFSQLHFKIIALDEYKFLMYYMRIYLVLSKSL